MLDCHVHIENGPYTLGWIEEFVKMAQRRNIDELWLLEHNYRFREFAPMYDAVRACSAYIDAWFKRKCGVLVLDDYLRLAEAARSAVFPVRLRFGLEVCYFQEAEELIQRETKDCGLDFLVGSVHFVDGFAFDHKPEHWDGVNVDTVYRRYFETSAALAESRLFNGIAHPDCIKLFGHRPSFPLEGYYDALASALHLSGMYAEQNSGAHRRCPDTAEPGMAPGLITALNKHGVPVLTASDAHYPADLGLLVPDRTPK